jgi:hypothetical protein
MPKWSADHHHHAVQAEPCKDPRNAGGEEISMQAPSHRPSKRPWPGPERDPKHYKSSSPRATRARGARVGTHQCSVLNRTAVACRRRRLLFFAPSLQLLSLPSVSAFVAPHVLTPAAAFTGMHLQIFHRHAPTRPGIVQSNQGHGLPRLSTFFDSLTLVFSRFTLVYIKSTSTY